MTSNLPNDPRQNWAALSQAERDAAYDNTKAVANSAALVAARNEASAKFRADHAGALDIPYGKRERAKIDLYPGRDKAAPCLCFIHGGYWQRNSREVFATLVEGVAAHGWSVAIPGYTLAPQASLSEIVGEVSLALDWLGANGASYGIAGPVVLSGWSAGAHLTAMALDHPVVAAGLAISGVYELGPIRDTELNVALKLSDEEVAKLSPLRLPVVKKHLAIAYGSAELPALVWDAHKFYQGRAAAGAAGELIAVDGADHFTVLEQLQRADGALTRIALALAGTPT
jgi:acetyl esterase/lipase